MDFISNVQHSIDTSIDMKIFKNRKDASLAHIFNSKLVQFPLSEFKNVDNFDNIRLQRSAVKAYPVSNRPRGNKDISSVKFHQKQIKNKKGVIPIWIIETKKNNFVLLDGAHRIVAHYIENKKYIPAYVIKSY